MDVQSGARALSFVVVGLFHKDKGVCQTQDNGQFDQLLISSAVWRLGWECEYGQIENDQAYYRIENFLDNMQNQVSFNLLLQLRPSNWNKTCIFDTTKQKEHVAAQPASPESKNWGAITTDSYWIYSDLL